MMACSSDIIDILFPFPDTVGTPPQLSWDYRAQRGGVHFGPGMMPFQSDNWRCFDTLDTTDPVGFMYATHSCSYMCALSSFVNITNNLCLLSSEGADLSVASFCTTFPQSFPSLVNACHKSLNPIITMPAIPSAVTP
eukprot:gene32727-11979_t